MKLIPITKTLNGLTASEILATASVQRMAAGTYEVVSSLLPEYIIEQADDGTMVVACAGGAAARMEIDDDTLDALIEAREAAYY
jgi:hypothetical protein